MKKNVGQIILKKAKKLIPGGNQLLSKRSEMFLPNHWPNYYKKSLGCEIWDLENKRYYDGESYIHKDEGHEHLEIRGNRDYKDKKLIKENYQVVLIDENDNFMELDSTRRQVLEF